MLKILLKKQLSEFFSGYIVDHKTGEKKQTKKIVSTFILLGFLFLTFFASFFMIFLSVGLLLVEMDLEWLLFGLAGLFAIFFGVLGSVFATYNSVYLSKDNDLLLSLPIPSRYLLIARIFNVYLTSLLFSGLIWIPAMFSYYFVTDLTFLKVILPIFTLLLIALFVCALSCVLGYFVALIIAKTKGKNIINVIISLVFLGLYYVIYFKVIDALDNILLYLEDLENIVRTWFAIGLVIGKGATGELLWFLLFAGIVIVIFAIVVIVMNKNYFRLSLSSVDSTIKDKKVSYNQNNISKSLLKREFKHFSSTPSWMLNAGLGLLLMPALAIYAAVKTNDIAATLIEIKQALPSIANIIPCAVFGLFTFLISTNIISSIGLSIEGNTFWILKSLPISNWDIIKAKIKLAAYSNIVSSAISSLIILIFALKTNILLAILTSLAICLFCLLSACFNLIIDIKNVNFSWLTETQIVKQSKQSLICVFGGWLLALIFGIGNIALANVLPCFVILLIDIVLNGLGCFLTIKWLKKKGTKIIQEL